MELFGSIVRDVLEIMLPVLCAELTAGLVHWFEDAYIRDDTPLIGRTIGRPNMIHHHYPRHMTRNNWWQSSYDLVIFAVCLIITCWCLDLLTWPVWLYAILCANANEIHKWTHRSRKENGPIITWLQDARILQTPKHHLIHHKDPKNSRYCTMTNWLNPVLDAIHFWGAFEWVLAHTIGLRRRPDTSLRDAHSTPGWMKDLFPLRSSLPLAIKAGDCAGCNKENPGAELVQASHTSLSDPATHLL